MASHNYIIAFVKQYQHSAYRTYPYNQTQESTGISLWSQKNSTLKFHDHESESYNHESYKNFLLKITQLSPWQITFGQFLQGVPFLPGTNFCGCHICLFQVEYLSCAIVVRCRHYFQMALKGAIFVECVWLLSNCNYLLFYQQL